MEARGRLRGGWLLALLLGTAGLSACAGGSTGAAGSPTTVPTGPPGTATGLPNVIPTAPHSAVAPTDLPTCKQPAKLPFPGWVPRDLPLPRGTYLSQRLTGTLGYQRGIFVVPGTLQDMTRFVLTEWPKRGWVLGRGDAEPGEVEDQFSRPPSVGAFKAQAQFCTPGYNLMLLIYVADRTKLQTSPAPGTQPGSPLPSASPTPSG